MFKARIIMIVLFSITSFHAFAGASDSGPVSVIINEDGSGLARGSMYHARNSPNDYELIGCGIKGFAKGSVPRFGFCQAADSEDNYVSCFFTKAELIDTVKAVADNSYLRFDFDEDGDCTRIDVSTQSFYLPGDDDGV